MQTSPDEYTVELQGELIISIESESAKRTVWMKYWCLEFHLWRKEGVFWWKGESCAEEST
jgi:hypothetical protein